MYSHTSLVCVPTSPLHIPCHALPHTLLDNTYPPACIWRSSQQQKLNDFRMQHHHQSPATTSCTTNIGRTGDWRCLTGPLTSSQGEARNLVGALCSSASCCCGSSGASGLIYCVEDTSGGEQKDGGSTALTMGGSILVHERDGVNRYRSE